MAIAVIIAIIVVVAGVGGYFYYTSTKGIGSTSSSTTTTTTATGGGSGTTSTGSSTTSPQFAANVGDLLGNFSQMTIGFNTSSTSGGMNTSDNGTISYLEMAQVTNSSNNLKLTPVNYTFAETAGGTSSRSSYLIYYNSTWGPEVVTYQGSNFTSSTTPTAQELADTTVLLEYTVFFGFQSDYVSNPTLFGQLTNGGTSTQTFGSTQMSVTTYTANSLSEGGNSVTNFKVSVGQVPGKNFSVLTFLGGTFSSSTESGTFSFNLVSATLK
jgi:hypothetical protein